MAKVAIYTLTSPLHNEEAVNQETQAFLATLNMEYDLCGTDYSSFGTHVLDLIYVRTGGTEGVFQQLLPQLEGPFFLLTSGKSNSLAASMEILSYLRQQGLKGEIIHGSADYIRKRISVLCHAAEAREQLRGMRLGIIGKPSDWLISSSYAPEVLRERLGIELVQIPMDELLTIHQGIPRKEESPINEPKHIREAYPGAVNIYLALRLLIDKHHLNGLTIRCFDLLTAVKNTGCWALARLNADGFVAGCEGDVPALVSMAVAKAVTGKSGFQANPAAIDPEKGEILFAHCTIPLNMVNRYELDTHYESGIGIGIRGFSQPQPVTVYKASGDFSRRFAEEGELLRCEAKPGLCRTQWVVRLHNTESARYFLTDPIGNHHIVVPGHHQEVFRML